MDCDCQKYIWRAEPAKLKPLAQVGTGGAQLHLPILEQDPTPTSTFF